MAAKHGSDGSTVGLARWEWLRAVAGSALMAAAATFAVGWPAATQADGLTKTVEQEPAESDEPFVGETQLGSLLVDTRIVADDERAGRYALEVRFRNTTSEAVECAEAEACLERTTYNPMDRGAPPPTVVWRTKDATCVPAGQTVAKRMPIPAGYSARIKQASLPPKMNQYGMPVGPVVAFAPNILQLAPAAPPTKPGEAPKVLPADRQVAQGADGEPRPAVLSLPRSKLASLPSVLPPPGRKPMPDDLGF